MPAESPLGKIVPELAIDWYTVGEEAIGEHVLDFESFLNEPTLPNYDTDERTWAEVILDNAIGRA